LLKFALPDHRTIYKVLLNRNAAHDGQAFVGVSTTGVFCRLACTARKPKSENCAFSASVVECITAGFASSSPQGFVNGIKTARQQIVARTDENRDDFLRKRGFSKTESGKIIEKVLMEEGRPPESASTSCRASRGLRATRPSRMPASTWRGGAKKLLDRVG
jgi:Metal binding domain of Ada